MGLMTIETKLARELTASDLMRRVVIKGHGTVSPMRIRNIRYYAEDYFPSPPKAPHTERWVWVLVEYPDGISESHNLPLELDDVVKFVAPGPEPCNCPWCHHGDAA